VRRFSDPLAFQARSEAFLLLHEAAHNLLLGLIAGLARGSVDARFSDPPDLATLEAGAGVVGVALRTPPFNLVLSEMPREVLALLAADVHAAMPFMVGRQALLQRHCHRYHHLGRALPANLPHALTSPITRKITPILRLTFEARHAMLSA
jgi:hypothetical protein